MCTVCGCQSEHAQHPGHSEHGQEHAHDHQHDSDGALNFATGAAGTSVPGQSQMGSDIGLIDAHYPNPLPKGEGA